MQPYLPPPPGSYAPAGGYGPPTQPLPAPGQPQPQYGPPPAYAQRYGPPAVAGPRPAYPGPAPMQPFQPLVAPPRPGVAPNPPQLFAAPGMLPPYMQPYGPVPAYHAQRPSNLMAPLQPPLPAALRSGAATPKAAASGAATPVHPMQRSLSGGAMLATPPSALPPGYLSGPQAPYLMPPGIVLPDSLSPGSPAPLRPAGSAPGSRAQSATTAAQLAHARAASLSGPQLSGPMEPLGSPPRGGPGLGRTGSAGSLAGGAASVRSSLDLNGGASPVQRTSERAGSAGGGAASPLQAHRAPSLAGSRAGSAGRKGGMLAAAPDAPDEFDNIKVAVRVRPPNAQELARADAQALFVNPSDFRQVQLAVPAGYSRNGAPATRNFTFHACLGPASRQQDVLRLCGITQLLDAALDGYNATVMAYGQTGSGKTFTMSGREEALVQEGYGGDSDDGIIARSMAYLFEQLAARGAADGCRYNLRCSFAEIYNEQVYDLIRFDRRQLPVRWEPIKGFHVPDLACHECSTLQDTLKLLSLAVRHRRVGSHELNMESSRSHSIFTVYVDCTPTRPDDHEFGMTRFGKVSFVDLAGSERLRDSRSAGETLRETASINRSLFMLGKVIAALADGAQGARVPYRESKLTKLLMDSLGGSSLSLLIACCSPSAAHIEETLSTLSYAARAKNIRNQPAVQMDPDQAALAALRREIKLLRTENVYLREQLVLANQPRGAPPAAMGPAAIAAGISLPASRLPSSHGIPPDTPASSGAAGLPGAGGVPAAQATGGAGIGSRPASGSEAGAGAGGQPSSEDLMRRLLETQHMLVAFSRENDRLASENGRLRTGTMTHVQDYKGALEEVDWLRAKLESLETALLAGSLDSGLLAALDGGGDAADVLQAARAAVLGSSRDGPDLQPDAAARAQPGILQPLAGQLAAAFDAAAAAAAGGEAAGATHGASARLGAAPLLAGLQLTDGSGQAGDGCAMQVHAVVPQEQEQLQRVAAKAPLIDPHLIVSELQEAAISGTPISAVWPSSEGSSTRTGGDAVVVCSAAAQDAATAAALSESGGAEQPTEAVVLISRPPAAKGVLAVPAAAIDTAPVPAHVM